MISAMTGNPPFVRIFNTSLASRKILVSTRDIERTIIIIICAFLCDSEKFGGLKLSPVIAHTQRLVQNRDI